MMIEREREMNEKRILKDGLRVRFLYEFVVVIWYVWQFLCSYI